MTDHDKVIIEKARDKLQEGASALMDRQKMIRQADSTENGWGMAREYKDLYEFADNEEDITKIVNCDCSAGEKRRRIAANRRHVDMTR